MKEESYYMRRYRKTYSIQVNKLKLEINGIQFGKIAKILHLQELNIEPEPNLVFCVYNLGIQKEQRKIDKKLTKETTLEQKTRFNIYWAIYPKPGRKDYLASLATFCQIKNMPDPDIFYGILAHISKKWLSIPAMNDFLQERVWDMMNKGILFAIEQNREEYKSVVDVKIKKYLQENVFPC